MDNTSHKELFKDYYLKNKGTLFRSFEIHINEFHNSYDIYWGNPNIIFDASALIKTFPLAVTTIPHRRNYPNPRIFVHEKLEKKYKNVFELVIAHEIGHIWLHDIVGFNNPNTSNHMKEDESERWADYFSYRFFLKNRNIASLIDFSKILHEASNLQISLYNLDSKKYVELTFAKKINDLKLKEDQINYELQIGNQTIMHMRNAIEITLNALGDIFE